MGSLIKSLVNPEKSDATGRKLAGLAKILGTDAEEIDLPTDCAVNDSWMSGLLDASALISSAETLAALLGRNHAGLTSLDSLASHLRVLLIYGLERCSIDSARRLFGSSPIATGASPVKGQSHRYH